VTIGATETVNETKETQAGHITRGARKLRSGVANGTEAQRFFLAKPGSSGAAPELDKELPGEAQAMGESFKTGLNYFVVSEWRGVADFSGKKPQLSREAARNAPKAG
jgi:hypothetical protein